MAQITDPSTEICRSVLLHLLRKTEEGGELAAAPSNALPGEWPIAAPASAAVIDRAAVATTWIHALDARDGEFGPDMFFDPAWNMLLDLYVHHVRGTAVAVSSLCIASRVPMTTASRWLAVLQDRLWVERRPDLQDRRRHFVGLTALGAAKMDRALDRSCDRNRRSGVA